jgi:hypothetical protein
MGDERQTGQEALRRSQASRHMRWKRWRHSGMTRCISPSRYSQRQMEQAVSVEPAAAAAAREKGALG